MSNTLFIFLRKANIPTRAALQASIDKLGFDLQLDPELDILNDSGFSPCVLNGVSDVGFELLTGTPDEIFGEDLEIAGDNNFCIGLVWHSSMKDCAAAMIASCAFAKDFGAVVSYEGEPPESVEKLFNEARGILPDAMNEP